MRCFIALEFSDVIKDRLQAAQDLFKDLTGKIGWCSRDQMHLTLKFLGDIHDDRIDEVAEVIRTAAVAINPFPITIEGLGAFPLSGQPRVLWVGVRSNPTVDRIAHGIEDGCASIGFPVEERDFKPHLTLGRIKDHIDTKAYRQVIEANKAFRAGTQTVDKVVLFSSQLKPSGAVYTAIKSIELI